MTDHTTRPAEGAADSRRQPTNTAVSDVNGHGAWPDKLSVVLRRRICAQRISELLLLAVAGTFSQLGQRADGQMDRRTDGQTDRRTDGQMDRWTDG